MECEYTKKNFFFSRIIFENISPTDLLLLIGKVKNLNRIKSNSPITYVYLYIIGESINKHKTIQL